MERVKEECVISSLLGGLKDGDLHRVTEKNPNRSYGSFLENKRQSVSKPGQNQLPQSGFVTSMRNLICVSVSSLYMCQHVNYVRNVCKLQSSNSEEKMLDCKISINI